MKLKKSKEKRWRVAESGAMKKKDDGVRPTMKLNGGSLQNLLASAVQCEGNL